MNKHFCSWYVVRINTTPEALDSFSNICFELGAAGAELHDRFLESWFDESTDINRVENALRKYAVNLIELRLLHIEPNISTSIISEQDWAENWKQYFTPVQIGKRFLIVPPWERTLTVPERITIFIEPGMAFGTGNHASTQLALRLIDRYVKQGNTALDAGTGTGILAIAAAKICARDVFAIDPDEYAVDAARHNAAANNVSNNVTVEKMSFELLQRRPFDVITANLNRTLLLSNAEKLSSAVKMDGILIISGIETVNEREIHQKFSYNDFILLACETQDSWLSMAFKKTDEHE